MTRILVVAPHPDDAELGMGGTIAKLADEGHQVLLLDLTDGEPTPCGDPATRRDEAARAAEILGVPRRQLDLPNRSLEPTLAARRLVAGVIREHRAEILFAPAAPDAHPDHVAATRIVEDARFEAKLTKTDLPGDPTWPRWLFYYHAMHLRRAFAPDFCLDTTGYAPRKRAAILAYESQFVLPESNRRIPEWLDAAGIWFGSRIGVETAEPFAVLETMGLSGLESLSR